MKRKLLQNFELNRIRQTKYSIILLIGLFIVGFNQNVAAQCFITNPGTVNTSTLTCGTSPLSACNGSLTVGDGSTATNINMNAELDLTCLGTTQITVKKYSLFDFRPGSYRLYLAEGSSMIFEPGSDLLGGNGSNCSASERIYIGTNLLASCNGGAGADLSFADLLTYGGTGSLASNSPVCEGSQITLTATPPPTSSGTFMYSFSGPGLAATTFSTSPTYSFTATASSAGTYQVKIKNSGITNPMIAEISVSVNTLPATPTITAGGSTTFCAGGSVILTSSVGTGYLWSTGATTQSISPTTSGSYTVQVTNAAGCLSASSLATVVTVNPIPTITGTTPSSVCGTGTVTLGATASTGTINWYAASSGGSSLGTGTSFTTPSISSTTTYYVDATNLGCTTATRTAVMATENPVPVITTQPTNQLDCEGSFVNFKVVASGTGLTYTWQYKRPTDGSFITFTGAETNTTYPSAGEIRIANVGSAQYPDGTQFKVVVSNGACSVTSNAVTLSVNEIIALTPNTTNVVQCYGTNYSYTVTTSYPANVVSYQWKKSVVSGTWTSIVNGGAYSGANTATLTITGGTPAESAEYRVYITFNNSTTQCSVDSSTRTRILTFLPLLTTPETTIIQPTCSTATGTITVAVQSASDTYSFDNGVSFQAGNMKSGLAVGSYNVIIKNIAGCVSSTTNRQIISETSIWDGTSWLNGVPDVTRRAVFQQNFNSTSDLEACSCQVTGGASVVINSAHTLKVVNSVDVISGSLTFENNASLIQVNDAAINTGNINYKRYTAPVRRYDFTYWSSPVVGQTLKNLSPNTLEDKYYGYNPNTGWVIYYNGAATMVAGNGYLIRAPQTFSITDATVDTNPVFIGKPNNGVVSLALTANKAYLLGNPYPSAIDADKFLDANSAVLEGTLYFWTHNTSPTIAIAGDATYNYNTNDYATYNRTGGVSTGTAAVTGGLAPTGKIAAGQGFFAQASTAGGTTVFNNSMRLSSSGALLNNSQFFKLNTASKTSATAAIAEKSRIWLNLTNKEGAFKQTLVGYITGATNNYDAGFDGVTYDGNQYVDFYSVNQAMNLSIQGRALPFVEKDSVALGYKSTIKGEFQISIDHVDGELMLQTVFLEDKVLKVLHDLRKGPYTFSTEKGVFNTRFVLRYIDKNAVGQVVEKSQVDETALVSVNNNEINVSSIEDLISKIIIYDISGKIIYQKDEIGANDFAVEYLLSGQQVLFVNVVLANGKTTSTKIIY